MIGVTGFLGPWLVEPLLAAGADVWVVSRSPIQDPLVHHVQGDIRSFIPPFREFDLVIHGAASHKPGVIVDGTAHLLRVVDPHHALFLSSGAVYGAEAPLHVTEDAPLCPTTDYGTWKAKAEEMCLAKGWSVARLFSFICPGIPLTDKFAAGAFIRDALAGGPIQVTGDPEVQRSYLYGTDLANAVFRTAFYGEQGSIYNIGSDEPKTIGDLAQAIARVAQVAVSLPEDPPPPKVPIYVPSTRKIQQELYFKPSVPFEVAVKRTFDWARRNYEGC